MEVDPESRRARVRGGALWSDLDGATQPFGLAAPGGVVSDTVAGLTLGGGYGWLRRKHGLSSDNLLEAEVVTADELRRAAPDENPELFWALRGGGGNFGVVTSFTFQLHPVGPEVAFAATFYPIEEAAQVMRGWRDFVEQAPEEVTATCDDHLPANPEMPEAARPPGDNRRRRARRHGGRGHGDAPALREPGRPLRHVGTHAVRGRAAGLRPTVPPRSAARVLEVALPERADRRGDRPDRGEGPGAACPLTLVNAFHMGGAIADVGEEDTAFAERSSPYMVSIDGMWDEAADDEAKIEWVRAAWREIGEHANGAVYLNFTGLADEALTPTATAATGATSPAWPRSRRGTTRRTCSVRTTTSGRPPARPELSAAGLRRGLGLGEQVGRTGRQQALGHAGAKLCRIAGVAAELVADPVRSVRQADEGGQPKRSPLLVSKLGVRSHRGVAAGAQTGHERPLRRQARRRAAVGAWPRAASAIRSSS